MSALGLANVYAQTLGTIFSEQVGKPYEVELVIAEVGDTADRDQIYRLTYDGAVFDESGFVVIGGPADAVSGVLKNTYEHGASLGATVRTAVAALARDGNETRELEPSQLEVAVLDRNRKQDRKFRRLIGSQLARLLADEPGAEAAIAENGNDAADEAGSPESEPAAQGDLLDDIDDALDGEDGDEDGPGN